MKYPIEIEKEIKEIESIVNSWPVRKKISEVISWVLQFDNEDFDLAFRIIKNINVIGPEELNSALAISYSKLMRQAKARGVNLSLKNTMYAAIGGASKSGAMIAYNFRLINELSSANFLDEDSIKFIEEGKIDNLVLVDDIIGTGDQSSKELKELAERVIPLGIKNIFVITAVGFKIGIKKVQDTQLADVFSALEYDDRDCLISLDSKFYDGLAYGDRKSMYEKMAKYKGLGYEGLGALIVFYYNTPNCTVNSIWADSYGWLPLFPRISNVSGIDKHYPELDNAIAKPVKETAEDQSSLTIFVEGKTEEIFFEQLAIKHQNFGYVNFDAISIGPFYSEKLVASLKNLAKNFVLVTEREDNETPHSKRVKAVVKEESLLVINEVISYFKIEELIKSDSFGDSIDNQLLLDDPGNSESYLEMKLFKKVPSSIRQSNMELLVKDYLDEQKVQVLIADIKNKLDVN